MIYAWSFPQALKWWYYWLFNVYESIRIYIDSWFEDIMNLSWKIIMQFWRILLH